MNNARTTSFLLLLGAGSLAAVLGLRLLKVRPSMQLRLARLYLRLRRKRPDLTALEHTYRTRSSPQAAPLPASLRALCTVEESRVQGCRVIRLTPRRASADLHLLYLHGGSYVDELIRNHWELIEALIRATGARVTVPLYPLAPEHSSAAAFALLDEVYLTLLATTPAEQVVLCGDSAGGGLALAQTMRLRDAGLPQPGRTVLFAPWLDLMLRDPAVRAAEQRDLMLYVDSLRLCGSWWAAEQDTRKPALSPLYGDLTNLPPIDLYIGTDDLFIVDARTFERRAHAAGAAVRLYETPGGFHVFMAVSLLPESQQVYEHLARTLGVS
ncbi:alpha/beta hydrolase (plasmid) [Deinococcus sp. KNUC1210]|uniref:alpha/beta hydrolase n=1 Tax=Deinococcus sp. KNUC1210 TaxID=2917691 RepID=UPI001EF064D1|nr:alpha/beta hydrolase [Deinococcus sp. KNUC1210]ULH17565.1 alpha/beta hydrolase [Deinococcus sp. KNUC1210]